MRSAFDQTEGLTPAQEQVRQLAFSHPQRALASVECPTELWWALTDLHPWDSLHSPLFDLLTLESPERWAALEKNRAHVWVQSNAYDYPLQDGAWRLLAVDYARRLLPLFEANFPGDRSPHQALEAAEKVARGKKRTAYLDQAFGVLYQKEIDYYHRPLGNMALQAAKCACAANPSRAARNVAGEAQTALYHVGGSEEMKTEGVWQWRRMLVYLRAHPTLPSSLPSQVEEVARGEV